jgi:phosphoglycerate dehydrogenase-like enzyme
MATYNELRQLYSHSDLTNRIEVAVIVAAEKIRTEASDTPNHANRLVWAKATFGSTRRVAEQMLMALLAANRALPTADLIGVTDEGLQAAVDGAVNIFADGN